MDSQRDQIKTEWKDEMWNRKWLSNFYLNRQNSQGGDLALGVEKDIESTLVICGRWWCGSFVSSSSIRRNSCKMIVGYGPQENDKLEKKNNFWEFIENGAEFNGQGVIMQMDDGWKSICCRFSGKWSKPSK